MNRFIVYGSDDYRVCEFIKSVGGSNVTYVKDKNELPDAISKLTQLSMFSLPETIVIENLTKDISNEDWETIRKSPKNIIIYETQETLPVEGEFLRGLKGFFEIKKFSPLSKNQLREWVKTRLSDKHIRADTKVIESLAMLPNLWFIENEITKLRYLSVNKSSVVTYEDYLQVCADVNDQTIYKLTDAIGNLNVANIQLEYTMLADYDEWAVFYGVVGLVRNLLKIKVGIVPKLPSFVVDKLRVQAKRWSDKKLIRFHMQLSRLEDETKQGLIILRPTLINATFAVVLPDVT